MILEVLKNCRRALRRPGYLNDVGWLASAALLTQIITLGSAPIFSRLFRPEEFAIQNLFNQAVGIFAIIATWRYDCLVQIPGRTSDATRLEHLVLFFGVFWVIMLTPILWLFSDHLGEWTGAGSLGDWLILVPVSAVALSLSVAIQARAQRERKFRLSGEAEIAGKLGILAAVILGFFLLPGPGGLVLGGLAGSCLKIAWLMKNRKNITFGGLRNYLFLARKYFKAGGFLVLSHIFLSITTAIPSFFIASNYGLFELGQFAIAYQVISLPSVLIASAIGSVYFQRASERRAEGRAFGDLWLATARALLLIGIPVYTVAVFSLPYLIPLVFGHSWDSAGAYASILAIGAFFSFITGPLDRACLVVNAWLYVPIWHAARACTTALVALVAAYEGWGMELFLAALVFQQGVLYLIDYFMERHFAYVPP